MISRRRSLRFLAGRRSGRIRWKRRGAAVHSGVYPRRGAATVLTARRLAAAGNSGYIAARVQTGRPRRRRRLGRPWVRDARQLGALTVRQRKSAAHRRCRFAPRLHQLVAATHEVVQLDKRRRRRRGRLRQRRYEFVDAAQRQIAATFAEQFPVTDARQIPWCHVARSSNVDEPRRRTQTSADAVSSADAVRRRRISVERATMPSAGPYQSHSRRLSGAERGRRVVTGPAVVDHAAVDVGDDRVLSVRGGRRRSRGVHATRHRVISASGRLLNAHRIQHDLQSTTYRHCYGRRRTLISIILWPCWLIDWLIDRLIE